LSRARLEVSVHEAAPELREIGAGVALHPNAVRVLRMTGVDDVVRRVGGHSEYSATRNWRTGRIISRISLSHQAATFSLSGAMVHRADLLDVIAAALPAGSVTLGTRCTGVASRDDVAVARFEDGREVEADVIVTDPSDLLLATSETDRTSGHPGVVSRGPAYPRLRESPICLLAARFATTRKRTCVVARVGGAATGADARVAAGWDEKER